jgi:hypothetical protein
VCEREREREREKVSERGGRRRKIGGGILKEKEREGRVKVRVIEREEREEREIIE